MLWYDKHILLVNKNKTMLSFALNYLGKQGLLVDGAQDYISALFKMNKLKFDLVVFLENVDQKEQDYIENLYHKKNASPRFLNFEGPIQELKNRIENINYD